MCRNGVCCVVAVPFCCSCMLLCCSGQLAVKDLTMNNIKNASSVQPHAESIIKNVTLEKSASSTISDLNSDDVLMGRGLGQSQYVGNKSFLRVVALHKAEYNGTDSYSKKAEIAKKVYQKITSRGGRFLKLTNGKRARNVVRDGVWYVADEKDALEKCKQSLRTQSKPRTKKNRGSTEADGNKENHDAPFKNPFYPLQHASTNSSFSQVQNSLFSDSSQTTDSSNSLIGGLSFPFLGPPAAEENPNVVAREDLIDDTFSLPETSSQSDLESLASLEDEETELAKLAVAGLPKFTEKQEELERSQLTDAERAAVMSDLFGNYCTIDPAAKSKRAKTDRDKDDKSIDSLIGQMRQELDKIPETEKQALVKAQAKCHRAAEFSDERLEKFLRREGMNPKLGAQRFVKYWEGRLEVFGPEKYLLRMTLSEALKDDLEAIEDRVLCVLPHLDSSGRQILYSEPHRRTPERYSSKSFLRALWYTIELLGNENTHVVSRGYVDICWPKNATIWDYDRYAYNHFVRYQDICFPIQKIASHLCCPSRISRMLIKPVEFALISQETRLRKVYHCVPESEILDALSEYGVLSHMLPAAMGGTVKLDGTKWIADRKAVEQKQCDLES